MPITLSHEIEISAPAEHAWRVIADYGQDPSWRTGVEEMTATPVGLVRPGTTTVEVLVVAGRTYRNLGEVTLVVPGARFEWRTTEGAVAHGAREVRALDPGRCAVRLDLEVTPTGVNRILAPLLGRMLARNLTGDVERLRTLVEQLPEAVTA